MIDIRQSENWGKYLEGLGWKNLYIKVDSKEIAIRIRKIPIVGSVVKIQRPQILTRRALEKIDNALKHERPLIIKMEPPLASGNKEISFLGEFGFKKDYWPLSASRSIHINLSRSKEKLFKSFSKDARYSIRKAQKKNLNVVASDKNLSDFHKLLKETGKRNGFYAPKLSDLKLKIDAFKKNAKLFMVYKDNIPVAGALILIHGKAAYYAHAGSIRIGQKLFAPYMILWNAIMSSKSEGCKLMDLEGIYDERFEKTTKNWKSFTTFKKKWGGHVVDYQGSFTKIVNPLLKIIFVFEKYLP